MRQGSWFLSAQILTRVISFFYTIFLARNLGVDNFGLYSVALAYFSLFSAISDFGFSRFLIREISKDVKKASDLVCNISILRLTLACVLFAILAVFLYFTDPDKLRVSLILLAVIGVLPQTVASVLDGIFVSFQKLKFSALAIFIHSIVIAVLGIILIKLSYGPTGAVSALVLGQIVLVSVLWIFMYRLKVISFSSITGSTIKIVLRESLPYGLLGILGMLYFKIDTILLSYLKGSFETGLYSAAYKFLEAIIFILSALSVTLFPVLARLHNKNPGDVKKLYFKSLKMMTLLGVLILVVYILVLPFVIKTLLPNYIGAINAVLILSLSIPFIFAQACAVQVLFSTDKFLKAVIVLSIITLSFNIILNLIFIPQYGLYAASWVTVASEILSFVAFFLLLRIRVFK